MHFRARRGEPRSLFKLLDRSIYLAQLQQDAAEHVAGRKHLRRKLYCFLCQWQGGVIVVALEILESHLHHRGLMLRGNIQFALEFLECGVSILIQ